MQYKDFEKIIYKLQAQDKLVDAVSSVIIPETFDNLYEIINILLQEAYTETACDIFFEYIYENSRSPVKIDSKEYKCKTIKDLHKIMEKLNDEI